VARERDRERDRQTDRQTDRDRLTLSTFAKLPRQKPRTPRQKSRRPLIDDDDDDGEDDDASARPARVSVWLAKPR
jgi:hypothetical protein